MTAVALGLVAVLLAGPVPVLLTRLTRLRHTPLSAILLWQAIALAAVLAVLGAGAAVVVDRHEDHPVVALAATSVVVAVAVRLLLSGHRIGRSLRQVRRRHRAHVDLLARVDAGITPRTAVRVLDHDAPVAYCLPGMTGRRIVVTDALLARLDDEELGAVLAHERSHLRARHDLLVEAFTVLHRAFPRWVSSEAGRREVTLLVEVLADRAAVRSVGRRPVAGALLALAGSHVPAGALGATGHLAARVAVLEDDRSHRLQSTALCGVAAFVVAVPVLMLARMWPGLPF